MNIIFARTRHKYDSYTDFWRLVELSSFKTCYVDQCDLSDNVVYITTMHGREWESLCKAFEGRRRRAHLILWNLERPIGWTGSVGKYSLKSWRLIHERQFDEIWVSDRRLAQETELRFVVLGSHPRLGDPGQAKVFDFVHMSLPNNRRQSIYKHLPNAGPNCWPPERDRVLKASKFALNVHQDDHPFLEPLRLALFAAYGLPILSETILDSYPWSTHTMFYAHYPGLVPKMRQLLADDYEQFRRMGMHARQLMCEEYAFDRCVLQAVAERLG